jgi:hypothetical protein
VVNARNSQDGAVSMTETVSSVVVLRTPSGWRYSVMQTPGEMTNQMVPLAEGTTFEAFEHRLVVDLEQHWGLHSDLVWSELDVDLWRADFAGSDVTSTYVPSASHPR